MKKLTFVIAMLLTTTVATACSSDETEAPPPCPDPVDVTSVTMGEFFYEPACAQASNGDTIEVINEGEVVHSWTLRSSEPRVEANLDGGDMGELTLDGLTPGTVYEVYCIYHSNMVAAFKAA